MKKYVLLVVALLLTTACQAEVYTHSFFVPNLPLYEDPFDNPAPFNTYIRVNGYDRDEETAPAALAEAITAIFWQYHRLFDRHNDYYENGTKINGLHALNQSYGTGSELEISFPLFDILQMSLQLGKASKGYFNIASGLAAGIWQDYISYLKGEIHASLSFPNDDMITQALSCTPTIAELEQILKLRQLDGKYYAQFDRLDRCAGGVGSSLSYNGVQLNQVVLTLGAIGKGYAVNAVQQMLLNDTTFEAMMIEAGGSSIATINTLPGQQAWPITIVDAVNVSYSETDLAIIKLQMKGNLAISTSAVYNNGMLVDGQVIHHIVDPFTARPRDLNASISLVGKNAALLDGLTTALICLEPTEIRAMVAELAEVEIQGEKIGRLMGLVQSQVNWQSKTSDIHLFNLNKKEYQINNSNRDLLSKRSYYVDGQRLSISPARDNSQYLAIGVISAVLVGGLVYGFIRRKKHESQDQAD